MIELPKPVPLVAVIPSLPGVRALFIAHDAEGNPVCIDNDPSLHPVVTVPVLSWGLLAPERGVGFSFGDLFGGRGGNVSMVALSGPTDEETSRLDLRKGFLGYAFPGETDQEAVDRIQKPQRDAEATPAARAAKRGTTP